MSDDPRSDGALLAGIAAGDPDACTTLVRRYVRAATLFAAQLTGDRDEAEDLVQTAFILAVERAHELDHGRPFAPWLFAIVRRLALKWHARRSHRRRLWARWGAGEALQMPSVEARVDAASDLVLVRRELAALPAMQRACFELVVLRDLGADVVAQMYEISESTVRQHVFRARRTLRARLEPLLAPGKGEWADALRDVREEQ